MIAPWTGKYIGVPYKPKGRDMSGLDCLGLLYLIYEYDLCLDLPDYDNYSHADNASIEQVFIDGVTRWQRIPAPEAGALVMLTIGGHTTHLGIAVGEGKFIHCMEGVDCALDTFDSTRWRERIEGVYKWNQ